MKVLHIKFTFSDQEWKVLKRFYKEREIRQSLLDGAYGELDTIVGPKLSSEEIVEMTGISVWEPLFE